MGKRYFTAESVERVTVQQDHLCAYCNLPFGSVVSYRGETVQTPVGDHFTPFSHSGATRVSNLVVSCQICNGIKSDQLFESIEHASRFILVRRMEKKIVTYFIPEHALTENPEAWYREHQRFSDGL